MNPCSAPGGEGRDEHALDQQVGVALHQHPVHPRARVAFVGVADQRLRAGGAGQEVPLHARGEVGPAAPGEPAVGHQLTHALRRLVPFEHARDREVASRRDVVLERLRVGVAQARQQAPLALVREERVLPQRRHARPRARQGADRERRRGAHSAGRLVQQRAGVGGLRWAVQDARSIRPRNLRRGVQPLEPGAGDAPEVHRGAAGRGLALQRLAQRARAGCQRGGVDGDVDARTVGAQPRIVRLLRAFAQCVEVLGHRRPTL